MKDSDPDGFRWSEIAETVGRLEELLARLPGGVAAELRLKIATLRTLVLERRPPALVLVGRRGSGKSSLVNALFGARVADVGHVRARTGRGRWFDFTSPLGTMAILDTRGVQEGSAPEEADEAPTPLASILEELRTKAPDAILFLVKAGEVDAAIDGDLDALAAMLAEMKAAHGIRPPVIGVVTHCDLLEPKNVKLHDEANEDPAEYAEKRARVAEAERALRTKLEAREDVRSEIAPTLGISSYLSFRADGTVRDDERWRIDSLVRALFQEVPDQGKVTLVRIARVRALQNDLATTLTRATAGIAAGVALTPIPVADVVPISSLQVCLVASIAWIGGRNLDGKAALEFLTALGIHAGAAFVFREAARALVKFVFPGAGGAVSAAVAFGGTYAIGAAAKAYFIHGATPEEARRAYDDARRDRDRDDDHDPRED
ncbi:MAG: GTPase [Polyangiaceae bacterium]